MGTEMNKQNAEIPGVNTKRSEIYWANPEEIKWNSMAFVLGNSNGCNTIPMEFPEVKLHFVWNFQG